MQWLYSPDTFLYYCMNIVHVYSIERWQIVIHCSHGLSCQRRYYNTLVSCLGRTPIEYRVLFIRERWLTSKQGPRAPSESDNLSFMATLIVVTLYGLCIELKLYSIAINITPRYPYNMTPTVYLSIDKRLFYECNISFVVLSTTSNTAVITIPNNRKCAEKLNLHYTQ